MIFGGLPLVDLVINVGIDYAIFMLLRCRHISLLCKVRQVFYGHAGATHAVDVHVGREVNSLLSR
jgi:hypothetical protein